MSEEATTVTYTVKELLARLDQKIDGFLISLDAKAEKEHVRVLESRLKIAEDEIALLKTSDASSDVLAKYRKWFIGIVFAVVGLAISLVSLAFSVH